MEGQELRASDALASPELRVLFFLNIDMRCGRGPVRTLLSFVKHKPAWVRVAVVQTDYLDNERLSRDEVRRMLGDTPVFSVASPESAFRKLMPNPVTRFLYLYLVKPILFGHSKARVRHQVAALSGEVDVTYLFDSHFVTLIPPTGSRVIGTTQSGPRTPFRRELFAKLVCSGLLYHSIDGFHLLRPLPGWQLREGRDFVLPSGVDTQLFRPPSRGSRNGLRFLFIGGLEPEKGLPELLAAFETIADHPYELHVAGSGSLPAERLARRGVIFHGNLDDDALAALYQHCDVFVVPSRGETFGLVVLEALASGMRVLASDAMRGLFADFDRFGCIDYTATGARRLAESMVMAINRSTAKPEDLDGVRSYIIQNYEWSEIVPKLYGQLRQTIGGR